MASRTLRHIERSAPTKLLATCCVMVEPPATTWPACRFWAAARAMPLRSIPECVKNEASSVASTALISRGGMRSKGTT